LLVAGFDLTGLRAGRFLAPLVKTRRFEMTPGAGGHTGRIARTCTPPVPLGIEA